MSSSLAIDQTYRYLYPSELSESHRLRLATCTEPDSHPHFFDGRLVRPAQTSALLRGLMRIVQARFHVPAAMLERILAMADPVVTCGEERLRFEGFSSCCGAYARIDLLPSALEGETFGRGTTNVDFNPGMLSALAMIRDEHEVRLSVGADELALQTDGQRVVEKKVKLPMRWLRGFVEVQACQRRMELVHEITSLEARRFLNRLPRMKTNRRETWVVPAGRGLRISQVKSNQGVRVGGLERLRVLEDLIRFADGLRVYRDDSTGASAWVLTLPDGLSRLCDQRPSEFEKLTGPLRKRTIKLLQKNLAPFVGMGPDDDVGGVVHAWTTGELIRPEKKEEDSTVAYWSVEGESRRYWYGNQVKPIGWLSARSAKIAERVAARRAQTLLSAATHVGGWISPSVLAERVNRWTGPDPDDADVCLALLRTAPDDRAGALKSIERANKEWSSAVKYALGAKGGKIGSNKPIWLSAARSRSTWEDDPRVDKQFPDSGPDGARAASYSFVFPSFNVAVEPALAGDAPADSPAVSFHANHDRMWELGGVGGRTIGSVRWTSTVWPLGLDAYFAAACNRICHNLDWWEAEWYNRPRLEPLLSSDTPLRRVGPVLIALGLAAKEPGEHGLSIDIAIQAIDDGRLGSDNLGEALALLHANKVVKLGRWVKTLGEIARVSDLHALVVQGALQLALSAPLNGKPPRDIGGLLDLLRELSLQLGLRIEANGCREFLATNKGSSNASKIAQALLKLEAAANPPAAVVLREAFHKRCEALAGRAGLHS